MTATEPTTTTITSLDRELSEAATRAADIDARLRVIVAEIPAARGLAGLKSLLNEMDALLAERGAEYQDYGVDITRMPIFGGAEPPTTDDIWSWDGDNLLLHDGARGWHLESRHEYFEEEG